MSYTKRMVEHNQLHHSFNNNNNMVQKYELLKKRIENLEEIIKRLTEENKGK